MVKSEKTQLFYIAVGKNIRKYRELRNYSLQDVADKVGLTKKTIQRYENGEIKIDMNRLADIAEALNVDISALLQGTHEFLGLEINDFEMVRIPIVGRISCGNGTIAFEDIEGYEPTPKDWVSSGEYFYLRAKGEPFISLETKCPVIPTGLPL